MLHIDCIWCYTISITKSTSAGLYKLDNNIDRLMNLYHGDHCFD